MKRVFKVGDIAEALRKTDGKWYRCEIVGIADSDVYHIVVFAYGNKIWKQREKHLRPIYDGNQPCTWENCIWKPLKEGVSA